MKPDPGGGVFETMLVHDGRPIELSAHLARLAASLHALYGMPLPSGIRVLAMERARAVSLGRLRVTVGPGRSVEARVAPVEPEMVFPDFSRAVRLVPVVVEGGLGGHKWADRGLLEEAEASAGSGAVPLLVDADGTVLEASRANVLVVANGALVTPPLDGRILPGIARRRVLELADVVERRISLERLKTADEVLLTGSVRGVEPVSGCEERVWEAGTIGPVLAGELRRRWGVRGLAKAVG